MQIKRKKGTIVATLADVEAALVMTLLDELDDLIEVMAGDDEPTQRLFPAGYRIPKTLRKLLRQKRIGLVNDVINAGSAVRGTFDDLLDCDANIVAIGALLALGTSASAYASSKNVPLECLATLPNNLWTQSECPLCAAGIPLEDVEQFKLALEQT